MDDFLSKPVRREALAATLQRWMTGPRLRVQLPMQPVGRREEPADGIDRAVLGELLGLGEAFGQVIRSYLETSPSRLDDLEAAVRDEDRVGVGRLAHLLAGSSGCVGASVLSSTCTALEQAMQVGEDLDPAVVLRLRLQHARAAEALHALLVPGESEGSARSGR
jgi:HPt (histidine-containing phosphotransfer) domain-containing protein